MDGHVLWLTGAPRLALIFAVLAVRRIGAMEVKIERSRSSPRSSRGAMTFYIASTGSRSSYCSWECCWLEGLLSSRRIFRFRRLCTLWLVSWDARCDRANARQLTRDRWYESPCSGLYRRCGNGDVRRGIGVLGVVLVYWLYGDPSVITGFGFGASSIALFARVGGGITRRLRMWELTGGQGGGRYSEDDRNRRHSGITWATTWRHSRDGGRSV